MKTMTSNIFKGLALLSLLASCSADESVGLASGYGDNAENAVYMGNPNASGVISIVASDDAGATFSVTPRLATRTTTPVKVTLEVDKATLEAYNKANNLSTVAVDANDVIFTAADGSEHIGKVEATINEGDFMATVPVRLTSLAADKYPYSGRYAIPVKITKVEGPHKLLSTPQSTIVNLNRKVKTSALYIQNSTGDHGYTMVMRPNTPYTTEMSEWTMQYIAQFQSLNRNNMTTASLGGKTGFYNRISPTSGLQVKSEGRDGDDTWTQKPIATGEWVHVSYVYRKNGILGTLTIYVNGELQKTFSTSLLYMNDDGHWGFGNSNLRNYYLREVRFWNRALTPAEIQDKYYLPEDPSAEGLEAYFPFSKESYDETTKTFRDLTGKWTWSWSPKIQDGTVTIKHSIVENIVFPAKSLTIEQ